LLQIFNINQSDFLILPIAILEVLELDAELSLIIIAQENNFSMLIPGEERIACRCRRLTLVVEHI